MPAKPSARGRGGGRRRAGRLALGAAFAVFLLAAGHALLWRWTCEQLEAGFAAWADSRRAEN